MLAGAAFRQATAKDLGEITVERVNVVDANGTLRMVISDKDRMHPGVMDGVTIDRPRPVAAMIDQLKQAYSERSARIGSIDAARRAGMKPATAADASSTPSAVAMTIGSRGVMP